MFAQIIPPLLHEIKIGTAISAITILLLISMVLLTQLKNISNPKLKAASFWASLNMLIIAILFVFFELLDFDQYQPPPSYEFVLFLVIIPLITTIIWLMYFFPLNLTNFGKKIRISLLFLWILTVLILLFTSSPIWLIIFHFGHLSSSIAISIEIIHSIIKYAQLPKETEEYSFREYNNYRLTGLGVVFLLLPSSISILTVEFLGDISYIVANMSIVFGILVIIFSLFREISGIQKVVNERYRQLASEAEVGIVRTDREGKITFYNKRLLQMLEIEDKSFTTNILEKIVHKEDFSNLRNFFNNVVTGEGLKPQENVFRVIGTELRWIQVKAVTHKKSNRYTFYLWDVSVEKSLAEIKNRFVATTSHELRTPLTVLKGYIEFLSMNPDLSTEDLDIIIKASTRSILRLENLISNVHDLSRIEAQVFKVERIQVTFFDIYTEILSA